ncbi:S8 family serine peptidase [Clostridium cellulovorans]|uniref:Peptidase S8 and S53 subtilisin kexin sedolisin n=1 Tax=Clostridium cellulovorans (strain ATCC 35296 / DSM 3052 / OCM 3 / 743B) TaxID=573061 RepID=D9SRH6_CLOC7|nr:S8 family serine peptidase [Clostridium cellulovorans]ADL52405.1 peptidase S8 and S53 subtilisin kexin sedolisin [Clostridium cellulovorans 743B]
MRKRLFGVIVSVFFLISLFSLIHPQSVLAGDSVEKKVNIENFNADKDTIIQNEIVVKYKNNQSNSKIFSYFGISRNTESKIEKIKVDNKDQLEQRINELQNDPNVESIQPNYKYEKFDIDNTSANNTVHAMTSITGVNDNQWYLERLQIPELWSQSTGKGIKIAVLDTGIDSNHEDLVGKVVGGQDFTGTGSYLDNNGHGTFVAGIIAADRANNIGISGIAYDSKLLSVKVLNKDGYGDTTTISKGIKWAADNGAKILNLSLGTSKDDAILKEAVNYAVSKGCIIIASSGNYGLQGITYPAAYDNVIAVGAINESTQWCYFSNFGQELDLVAPGSKIYSTVPQSINALKYMTYSGTSASTAIVSGEVSLLLSKQPQLTVKDILSKIKETSIGIGFYTDEALLYGNGILDLKKIFTGEYSNYSFNRIESRDNNTIDNAERVYNSTAFPYVELNPHSDVDWYRLDIPEDTVAKITITTPQKNIYANIFSDNFYYPDRILKVDGKSEYYISNYYSNRNFYLELYTPNLEPSNCSLNIQYLSINDPSIPKDQTLKYSIDSISQGKVITGNTLDISGWALSKLGITKVEAIVDNQGFELQYGLSRPDVYNAFKDYNDKESGFSSSLNISDIPYGTHSLKLMFTDSRGVISFSNAITFTTIDTLKYSLDTTKSEMTVSGNSLLIAGWALSNASIAKIEAIIDNDNPVALKYGLSRPDVYNAFKGYNNKNAGFSSYINIAKYGYGSHTLQVRLTYVGGRIEILQQIQFNISGTLKSNLDTLKSNDIITGKYINIAGWAISKAGIIKVEAVIYDKAYTLSYGSNRPDVYNAFKDYNNSKAGFSGTIDASKLPIGNYPLYIRITEVGGRVTIDNGRSFRVQNALYCLDTPKAKQLVYGNKLQVSGWALSDSGVAKVEMLVNDTAKTLNYGISRSDVYNAFPKFNNKNAGFSADIDISKLPYGTIKLKLRITDKLGRVWTQEQVNELEVEIKDTAIFGIDTPKDTQSVTGNTLNISGWALSKSGITKLEVLIDDIPYPLTYGISRPDVYNAYKSYNNQSAGFKGTVDISKLDYGYHHLKIRATNRDGRVSVSQIHGFGMDSTLQYNLETPTYFEKITNGSLNIRGWVLSKFGITKVEALIGDQCYEVQYNVSRPDIYNIYKDYKNLNSGFNESLDVSNIPKGSHLLLLRFTDGRGIVNSGPLISVDIQ